MIIPGAELAIRHKPYPLWKDSSQHWKHIREVKRMSEDEGQPRPVASRRQVWRMTRHHLVPLAAMGVAAAESVARFAAQLVAAHVQVIYLAVYLGRLAHLA